VFISDRMAEGYARWRPAVHPQIVAMIAARIGRRQRALDVGCGTGLSTAPLGALADEVVGLEPAEAMLRWSSKVASRAHFVVGRGEELPVRTESIDVITAAGSLDYADVERFVPEAVRVLRSDGVLVVYDFGPGREFRDSDELGEWFAEFERRWPWPAAGEVDVAAPPLNGDALRLEGREEFAIALRLEGAFYLDYVLTETNIEAAIKSGVEEQEIRQWCSETLAGVFGGVEREVVFRGYVAYLSRPGSG
jgi:SAM-dependent methyltransferase